MVKHFPLNINLGGELLPSIKVSNRQTYLVFLHLQRTACACLLNVLRVCMYVIYSRQQRTKNDFPKFIISDTNHPGLRGQQHTCLAKNVKKKNLHQLHISAKPHIQSSMYYGYTVVEFDQEQGIIYEHYLFTKQSTIQRNCFESKDFTFECSEETCVRLILVLMRNTRKTSDTLPSAGQSQTCYILNNE